MWTGGLRCYAWSHDCTHAYHFTRCRERRHKVRFRNLHSNLRSAWPPIFLGPYELQKNENKKNPTKPKINPTNVQASGRSGWLFSSSLNQRRRYIIVFTQHEEFRGRGEKRKKKREREKGKKINLQVNYRRRAIRAHPSPVCPKTTSSVLSVHFSSGKMSTVGPVRQVLMASWPYEVFIV